MILVPRHWWLVLAALLLARPAVADLDPSKGVTLRLDPVTDQRASQFVGLRKYGLVIGINTYENAGQGIPALRFARRDAEAVYRALVDPRQGAFRPEDTTLLTDSTETKPTNTAIGRALNRLAAQASDSDMVFLFFSGHGYEEGGRSYLLPANADLGALDYSAIERDAFVRQIDKIRAKKVVVVLDACHSGGVNRGGKGAGKDAALSSSYYESFAGAQGRAFIASCSGGELSWEDEASAHGVFSSSLVAALSGIADGQPADGMVSLDELRRYLETHVSDWAIRHGKAQHPQITLESAHGDMPLSINYDYLERVSRDLEVRRDDSKRLKDRVTVIEGLQPTELADALTLLDTYGTQSSLSPEDVRRLEFVRRLAEGTLTPSLYRAAVEPRIPSASRSEMTKRGGKCFVSVVGGVLSISGYGLETTTSIAPRTQAGYRVGIVDLTISETVAKGTRTGAYAGAFTTHLVTAGTRIRVPMTKRLGAQAFGGLGGFFGTAVRNDRTHVAYEAGAGLSLLVRKAMSASFAFSIIGSTAELTTPAAPQLHRGYYGSAGLTLGL